MRHHRLDVEAARKGIGAAVQHPVDLVPPGADPVRVHGGGAPGQTRSDAFKKHGDGIEWQECQAAVHRTILGFWLLLRDYPGGNPHWYRPRRCAVIQK